jgi:hypothetical protein
MQLQPSGQSTDPEHVMSGTHVRVPRLQILPLGQSVLPRHGIDAQVPATQL